MSRTTSVAVAAILGPNFDNTGSANSLLEPFIETASDLVDQVVECATNKGLTVPAARQELLERWLAAHYYAHMDQLFASKSTEGASASFQGQYGMMLQGTKYGQAALSMDSTGCLSAISKGSGMVQLTWLGKPASEQIDIEDRD